MPPASEPGPAARRERGLHALAAGTVPSPAAKERGHIPFLLCLSHREKGGILFMGTFHPAALLRQPQNKPTAFEDFVSLRETIEKVCDHTYQ